MHPVLILSIIKTDFADFFAKLTLHQCNCSSFFQMDSPWEAACLIVGWDHMTCSCQWHVSGGDVEESECGVDVKGSSPSSQPADLTPAGLLAAHCRLGEFASFCWPPLWTTLCRWSRDSPRPSGCRVVCHGENTHRIWERIEEEKPSSSEAAADSLWAHEGFSLWLPVRS